MERHHRPVRLPIEAFDAVVGGGDPADASRVAHDTARALLHRVRGSDDPEVVARTVRYTAANGIHDIAELWSRAAARTLPGSLWRLYLIHAAVTRDPRGASEVYRRGAAADRSSATIVAGAVEPTGPAEVRGLAERILRGAFTGDLADALDRAAAFCAVMSLGWTELADAADEVSAVDPDRPAEATTRAARYLEYAKDLTAAARLQRDDRLE
ncbi:MAG: DNA-directed RNA polymerase subunit beta [Microbacteriaceae bacterium]|nr:DNA-directed RNA polymerase subunit beta [Microbacteriaceae bacterium]